MHWQNNGIVGNAMSPIILLDGQIVYQITNASTTNKPQILKYNKTNGNYIDGREIQLSNFFDCQGKRISVDSLIFKSLVKRQNGHLLATGIVISYLGDMPFEIQFNPTNFNIDFSNVYVTRYKSSNSDFMSYKLYSSPGCNSNWAYLPLGTTSFTTSYGSDYLATTSFCTYIDDPNTLPTPNVYSYFLWTFSNNNSSATGIYNSAINLRINDCS